MKTVKLHDYIFCRGLSSGNMLVFKKRSWLVDTIWKMENINVILRLRSAIESVGRGKIRS